MGRLSRVELQERNRAKVLAAAWSEFAERGFRDAKVDSIAERAELTRGAVYSNFPSKRALYFAVLAERAPEPVHQEPGLTPREALGAVARAWVARLPLAYTGLPDGSDRLGMDLIPEVMSEERIRRPFAQLMRLDAILLGLALENLQPRKKKRQVRIAEAALTTLHGASQMAAAAPGFIEPFNVVRACENLAGLDLDDSWPPPPIVPQSRESDEPWDPPGAIDLVRGEPARLADDGVVAILGLNRASAAEDAVRAGAAVTAVLVTSDPHELAPLARLAITDLIGCLRQAFPSSAWPRLQVVVDETGAVAAAAGVRAVSDGTEVAVRIEAGRIVTRADGLGACHAVTPAPKPPTMKSAQLPDG